MKAKNLLFLFLSSGMFAQNFNYQRDWGTYFGATNTYFTGMY